MDTFGTVCRNVRVLKGLSQVEVATRGEIFQSRVSEIERDTYAPGLDLARSIARGLDVKLSALIAATEGGMTAEEIVGGADVGRPKEGRAGAVAEDPKLAVLVHQIGEQAVKAAAVALRGNHTNRRKATKRPSTPLKGTAGNRGGRRRR